MLPVALHSVLAWLDMRSKEKSLRGGSRYGWVLPPGEFPIGMSQQGFFARMKAM